MTRRTTSTRVTRLAARASPYHSAVTLYDLDSEAPEPGPSQPRSTCRVKVFKGKRAHAVNPGDEDDDQDASPPQPTPKSARKPKSKSKAFTQPLDVPHPTPPKWADAYAAIRAMRARAVAPVDTMGCQTVQFGESEPENKRFATLVALMLSSQTKEEVMHDAVSKLRKALGGAVAIQAVLDVDASVISNAIAKVGFWRKKTDYIKQTAQKLRDDFGADVPKTAEELCSLPGVGPKMAFLTLQVAWNLNLGICVDVHVHRITNRLRWHVPQTRTPEETRVNLESWLPKELHGDINHLLVGFGQMVCLPVGPKCGQCTLNGVGLCPSAQGSKNRPKAPKIVVKGKSGPKLDIEMET